MKSKKLYIGPISVSSRGVGYFHVEDRDLDLEIQESLINTALHGDTVEIEEVPQGFLNRPQAKVIKIIERNKLRFVGTLKEVKTVFFLRADDKRMYRDIFIHSSKAGGAKDGDKVLAEIISWKDANKSPEGKVLKVIGKKGVHEVEMEAIVLERGFDLEFPAEVETEAKILAKNKDIDIKNEIPQRKDMRDTLTFTIDPADAKDFDDALSFKKLSDNLFEIGIHIADVSHYVREKTELDKEARKRGTSIYLVDRTIPMLPEVLSNDLCSLNPNEDKLTFSAVFEMDSSGNIHKRWFGKTVTHSNKRFTYEDAQEVLDKKSGELFEELNILNNIAKKLQQKKFENGAIEFETEEVKFVLDHTGKPIKVYRKIRKDTHKMIEEYMLLANKEVATYIQESGGSHKNLGAFVYRIHDTPDKDKIINLSVFLKALGYNLGNENGEVKAEDLNNLMKEVTGKPEESLVKTAAIRSMSKAIYSTKNIGHFGLGFENYTHFTSPIRRYPDLLVHRLLFRYLHNGKVDQNEFAAYQKLADDASEKEISAADAERGSIKYKQVEYMNERIGSEFDATVSGVSEWGIYVEEVETKAEGMVRLRNMTDDFYSLDEKNYCIVGQTNKKKYSLGDKVRIKLIEADLDRRTLDFIFI